MPKHRHVHRRRKPETADFAQLDVETLKRYRRAFRVSGARSTTKYDMVLSVKKHFENFRIEEVPVIENFLEALDRTYELDRNHISIASAAADVGRR